MGENSAKQFVPISQQREPGLRPGLRGEVLLPPRLGASLFLGSRHTACMPLRPSELSGEAGFEVASLSRAPLRPQVMPFQTFLLGIPVTGDWPCPAGSHIGRTGHFLYRISCWGVLAFCRKPVAAPEATSFYGLP